MSKSKSKGNVATSASDIIIGTVKADKLVGNSGNDRINAMGGNDHIKGNFGNDVIVGGDGNDRLFGNGGDDDLAGGSGNDELKGGGGGDLLRYVPSDNVGASDTYDGGGEIDSLLLELTRDEWLDGDIQQDIANFLAFLEAHTDPLTGETDGEWFQFGSFDLKVRKIEDLRVTVDGVEFDPRDQPVEAVDDAATTATEHAMVGGNVLDNDFVPDTVRSVELLTDVEQGSLVFNDDGSWTYDPGNAYDWLAEGKTATEKFTYRVTDVDMDTDEATVTITVTGSNDGPLAFADAATTDENAAITVDVLANDTDADLTDTRTLDSVSIAAGLGTAAIVDNQVQWTPGTDFDYLAVGESATVRVDYTLSDNHGASASSTLTLTVTGSNDGPVAVADSATTNEDTALTILASDLLSNDSDADGDPLSILSVSNAANGVVALDGDGNVAFTPTANYSGPASFDYTVADGNGGTATTTATIDVNAVADAPKLTVPTGGGEIVFHDEQLVNSYTQNWQLYCETSVLADGGHVVVWESYLQDGSGYGVYGQRYDDAGNMSGAEFRLNTTTVGNQQHPTVTGLDDGGFVVAWSSEYQDGVRWGIYGQRFGADGNAVDGEFRVNTYITNSQIEPTAEALQGGGYVITWSSAEQDGDGGGVYAQLYDAGGSPSGGEFLINTTTLFHQLQSGRVTHNVAGLDDGGFVVTWQSIQDGSSYGQYAQRYDALGNTVGEEFQVNTWTSRPQQNGSVSALEDGGFVITWSSFLQDGYDWGAYGQRYDSDGNAVGGEFQINTETTSNQLNPQVAGLADGGFMVAWTSFGQDGDGDGIYGQRYDVNGVAIDGEIRLNQTTSGNQRYVSIDARSDGGYVVSWMTYAQDGSSYGIAARVVEGGAAGASGDEGTPIALDITAVLADTDGSESLSISIVDVPVGATLNAGTDNGDGTWTLSSADLTGLEITPPENFNGAFELTVTATATEVSNGDTASTSEMFTVTVNAASVGQVINGTSGVDILIGGDGDDVITGSGGPDILIGGEGDDLFVFVDGDGLDLIQDFNAGAGTHDVIDLTGHSQANNLSDIQAAASQQGGDTIIDLGQGDLITLLGVNVADLHQDDFLF